MTSEPYNCQATTLNGQICISIQMPNNGVPFFLLPSDATHIFGHLKQQLADKAVDDISLGLKNSDPNSYPNVQISYCLTRTDADSLFSSLDKALHPTAQP